MDVCTWNRGDLKKPSHQLREAQTLGESGMEVLRLIIRDYTPKVSEFVFAPLDLDRRFGVREGRHLIRPQ